jgi:hypothetical protein
MRASQSIKKYFSKKSTRPEYKMQNLLNKIVKDTKVFFYLILVIIEERKKKELTRKLQSANIIRR